MNPQGPTPFWETLRALLIAARKRSIGRRRRQRELFRARTGKKSARPGRFGMVFAVLFMLVINVVAAFVVRNAVETSERAAAERNGKIAVDSGFIEAVNVSDDPCNGGSDEFSPLWYPYEANRTVEKYGGSKAAVEQKLRETVCSEGSAGFIDEDAAELHFAHLPLAGRLAGFVSSWILALWYLMLICQGEGMDLDPQRRRHPMWEWLFSHPVSPPAVFLAEMLSPIAANPLYWGAPMFVGTLYAFVYGPALGLVAMIVVGVPSTVAAACLSKALEVGVTLRFAPRSRGAMMGLISWAGYASMMALLFGSFVVAKVVTALAKPLNVFTVLPWPWLTLFLGGRSDGSFSFFSGAINTWIASAVATAGAVWFSVWSAQRGLSGNFADDLRPSAAVKRAAEFGKEPLYRKEFLWFVRDRSAIVQSLLIPLTVAGFQLFNFRGLLASAQGQWNYVCGAAILFGTYFLWILGPRSLMSEGNALWIALTWPRGLESLLKAKAWLWSLISSALVGLVLCYAVFLFPASAWKVVLVGLGWMLFARSMADKTVTLVTVASESGERQPTPWGRRWAAQLGMLTFSIGVLTQQWNIAVAGIAYAYMTAAAMWQNFRARLPYLYDPWSEQMPRPPTLMHAMIGISILLEAGAVLTGAVVAFTGKQNAAAAQAVAYGVCALAVSVGMSNFLHNRGVSSQQVWHWDDDAESDSKLRWREYGLVKALALGAAGGVMLGAFAVTYVAVLRHVPGANQILLRAQEQMARVPDLKTAYAFIAIAFAPFAEEYLFRGLLYRALDREWGGWRAVVGSAVFFAVYHPTISWLPVMLLGIANALLFKKTGRLAPTIALHAVYNAVVVLSAWR